MVRYRFLIMVLVSISFRLIVSMEEGYDQKSSMQKFILEAKNKKVKGKAHKKKIKARESKKFFEKIKLEAESQSKILNTEAQLQANQNIINFLVHDSNFRQIGKNPFI